VGAGLDRPIIVKKNHAGLTQVLTRTITR